MKGIEKPLGTHVDNDAIGHTRLRTDDLAFPRTDPLTKPETNAIAKEYQQHLPLNLTKHHPKGRQKKHKSTVQISTPPASQRTPQISF